MKNSYKYKQWLRNQAVSVSERCDILLHDEQAIAENDEIPDYRETHTEVGELLYEMVECCKTYYDASGDFEPLINARSIRESYFDKSRDTRTILKWLKTLADKLARDASDPWFQ